MHTGTFRVKKKPENVAALERTAPAQSAPAAQRIRALSQESSEDTSSASASVQESPSEGEYNHLTDMVDVQVLARMQEDSEFTNNRNKVLICLCEITLALCRPLTAVMNDVIFKLNFFHFLKF